MTLFSATVSGEWNLLTNQKGQNTDSNENKQTNAMVEQFYIFAWLGELCVSKSESCGSVQPK